VFVVAEGVPGYVGRSPQWPQTSAPRRCAAEPAKPFGISGESQDQSTEAAACPDSASSMRPGLRCWAAN